MPSHDVCVRLWCEHLTDLSRQSHSEGEQQELSFSAHRVERPFWTFERTYLSIIYAPLRTFVSVLDGWQHRMTDWRARGWFANKKLG